MQDTELLDLRVSVSRYDLQSNSPVEIPFASRILGNQGAYKAAVILARTPSIKRVNLSNNGIGDFGISGLLKMLGDKAVANTFDFSDNSISDNSIKGIVSFLNSNRCVVSFDIGKNKITDLKALELGLVNNYSIMHLGVTSEELNRILLRNITHTRSIIAICKAYKAGTVLKLSKDLVRSINVFGVEGARAVLAIETGFSRTELNNALRQILSLCKDMRSSNGITINAAIAARADKSEYERLE